MVVNSKKVYSEQFNNCIETVVTQHDNPIVVILGDLKLISISHSEYVVDQDTLLSCDGANTFTKEWFSKVFAKIAASNEPSILSYAQYSYLITYIAPDFFKDRVIILKDNLRHIFPLTKEEFISDTSEDEDAAIELPIYQADQFKDEDDYYYSVKSPDSNTGSVVCVFTKEKELNKCGDVPAKAIFIDPFSDDNELGILINTILSGRCGTKSFYVKFYGKQPKDDTTAKTVQRINAFFDALGREVVLVVEDSLTEEFTPSDALNNLLKRYWGPEAKFRNITLYKNPDINNETIQISQGRIVQTLIDEYENVKAGREYRDVFLTAPTGAGKSLLFQIPAFYIADRGDVTIVISPLIALMKDQVKAIIGERRFERVAYINSDISFLDRESIIEKCKNGDIDILYMAPELMMSYDIRYFIGERKIGLIVIDEAHLITTWGRDFRVDYWYIGNQIRKIRKYSDQQFPMIAVTATAVYGGDKNDMVFDTVDSLVMHSPHFFIGVVKRDDIEFIINNYDSPEKGFDNEKLKQTAEFIRSVNELGFKTLVYAPYTNHVRKLAFMVNDPEEIAVQYYGSTLDVLSKDQAEKMFRSNERNVMICTKAFGMGVDIPDIQVVYHHAPSGLLPDYVQEIGRAARLPEIKGYATLNYCQRDQRYSNQLYGMSSLKLWQLKAVLRKLYNTYLNNGKKRNMLVSVDDFAFAFEDASEVDQKVKTALMMIEKDYLMKYRFNVVIARPKQLFTKVYSKVSANGLITLKSQYSNCFTEIVKYNDGSAIIFLDLQKVWSSYFRDKSFPMLKRDYYMGRLLPDCEVIPRYKLSYVFPDPSEIVSKFKELFTILTRFLVSRGYKYFDKDALVDFLKQHYNDRTSRQIAAFVLSTYSGEQDIFKGVIEENAFLQERHSIPTTYKVFNNRYEGSFAGTLSLLSKLLEGDSGKANRYVSKENSISYIRIGHILEILDIGSFEMRGGEAPMIFIRINSPETVKRDAYSTEYDNLLFDKTQEKHKVSTEIMNHFFTHQYSNEERWNFIEDFFLGENNEELIRRYPGQDIIRQDIIEQLGGKEVKKVERTDSSSDYNSSLLFPPRQGRYILKDHLTIVIDDCNVTRTISEWIEEDPVPLHRLVLNHEIYIDNDLVYKRLMRNIETKYPRYYTKLQGLSKRVNIPGYTENIMADVAMREDPVRFYKWWSRNREEVFIPLKEKIWLFNFIHTNNPDVLRIVDRKLLNSGS